MEASDGEDLKEYDVWAVDNAAEAEPNGRCMSPKFRSACMRLGMGSEALDWWEKIHVQSEAAIVSYFISGLVECAMYICLFFGAPESGPYSYAFRVPSLTCLLIEVVILVAWWDRGHSFHGKPHQCLKTLSLPNFLILAILGYLCPIEFSPFQSAIKYTTVLAVLTVSILCTMGLDPEVLAPERIKSLASLVMPVGNKTLKIVDGYTDFSFLQVLAAQKAAGCWWFGVEGRCNVYTVLQVVSWILTIVDLCVASLINITSMSISNMSPKMVKRLLYAHCVNSITGVGVITLTLLDLLSKGKNPSSSNDRHDDQIVMVIASMVSTILALCLTLVGAGSAFAGLKVVVSRVSNTGANLVKKSFKSVSSHRVAPVNEPAGRKSGSGCNTNKGSATAHSLGIALEEESSADKESVPSLLKDN